MSKCIVLETRGIITLDVFESLAQIIRGITGNFTSNPRLSDITCAASLAHHGLLGSVQVMELLDVDLTSVPAEHLASLVSSVTGRVKIQNVSGCHLIKILDSVKSKDLGIYRQSLGSEETQALVRAMESRVEYVRLFGEVTLDIRVLMEYSGQGKCREGRCYRGTECYSSDRYSRDQLRTWSTSKNWEVTMMCNLSDLDFFSIKRI